MNWTEFHFFRQPGGLSKNDALEMLVCLNYERALECTKLVEFVKALNQGQRARMLEQVQRYRRLSPFVPVEGGPPTGLPGLPSPPFQDFESVVSFPPIPAACVAASWFPRHWLTASKSKRDKVVAQVSSLYSVGAELRHSTSQTRFPIFPFPMECDEAELLIKGLSERETLHVIAI